METERANAARDKKKAELPQVTPPTLKELGLTKRESAEAQLLMETERAKGAQGTGNNQFKKVVQSPDVTAPTLAELGLTKRESADAQLLMETERAKPPGNNQHKKQDPLQHVSDPPTLAQLGLTKRESADAHAHGDGTGEAA